MKPLPTIVYACAPLLLAVWAGASWSQNGLQAPADTPWPRWQARIALLGAQAPGPGVPPADSGVPRGAQLFGDYYLFDLRSESGGFAGGLRATSGLSYGARGLTTGMPPLAGGDGLAWRARRAGLPFEADAASLPYIGFGVTGLWLRGGWSVSADIGLAGYASGRDLRLNAPRGELSSVDDVLRELRLTPALQLGVSYSF